jgi:hypothetical protein
MEESNHRSLYQPTQEAIMTKTTEIKQVEPLEIKEVEPLEIVTTVESVPVAIVEPTPSIYSVMYRPENMRPPSKAKLCLSGTGYLVELLPGENRIDADRIPFIKAHDRYETFASWQAIEIIESIEGAPVEYPDSLLNFSLIDQKTKIAQCSDRDVLRNWLDQTANKDMKAIIQLRITAVEQGR